MDNLILSLGNYALINIFLGNPTKGNLTRIERTKKHNKLYTEEKNLGYLIPTLDNHILVKFILSNLILALGNYKFTPGNSIKGNLTPECSRKLW